MNRRTFLTGAALVPLSDFAKLPLADMLSGGRVVDLRIYPPASIPASKVASITIRASDIAAAAITSDKLAAR